MEKQIKKVIRLQINGGTANPSPPIGPACGAAGINIMSFCRQFNDRTKNHLGKLLPVLINIYDDGSFDFRVKNQAVSVQLMEATSLKKGSKEPNRNKVAKIDWNTVKRIAENKMPDLNCFNLKSAMSMVAGTARSMGIEIYGESTIHKNNK